MFETNLNYINIIPKNLIRCNVSKLDYWMIYRTSHKTKSHLIKEFLFGEPACEVFLSIWFYFNNRNFNNTLEIFEKFLNNKPENKNETYTSRYYKIVLM